MTIDHYILLAHIQSVLSALVALTCFIKFQSRSHEIKLIGFIFLASCLANVTSFLSVYTNTLREYTNVPNIIYMIISFALFARLYYRLLKKKALWFVLVTVVFTMFALVNVLIVQKKTLNSYTSVAYSFVMIIYTLLYFFFLIRELPTQYVHRLPMFWVNAGLLFFHAGVFFLFCFTTYLIHVIKDDMIVYYSFHNILSHIELIMILIGISYDLRSLKWNRVSGSTIL